MYLAGQEGFEPPASGFGDRRSTDWSYWPVLLTPLSGFLVQSMLIAEAAVLAVLDPLRVLSFVLSGVVVASFTFAAGQYYPVSWHLF